MAERTIVDQLIDLALAEDIGSGDRTTEWTVDPDTWGSAVIVAKADCVVAGMAVALETFRRVEPQLKVTPLVRDGDSLMTGETLLRLEGPLPGILKGERVALNFLTERRFRTRSKKLEKLSLSCFIWLSPTFLSI